MRKYFSGLVCGAAFSFALASGAIAADTYIIDPTHTAVTWQISHFDFSHPSGKFMNITGELVFDEKNPANSSVKISIPIAEGNSGVAKLDEHLKGEDFFDVAKYPTATFESTSVKPNGDNLAIVTGNLTMRGVTKPVILDVKLNKIGKNMMDKQTVGFTAHTTVKRSHFGMVKYLPGLGDEVTIEIESEVNLAVSENNQATLE